MPALAILALSSATAASAATPSPGAPPAVQETLPEAAGLLDAYRAALGPAEKLAAVESVRLRGTCSWVGLEGPGTVTGTYAGLDRSLLVTEFEQFQFRSEAGTNGEIVWEVLPHEVKIRDGWDGSEYVRRFGVGQHAPWREMYSSARTAGKESLDGAEHWRIELTPLPLIPGASIDQVPPPDVWYLDVETHLVGQVVSRGVGADGKPTEVVYSLADWKPVDGILYPHDMELRISGFTMNFETTAVEHDVELANGFFALSERVQQALEDHRSGDAEQRLRSITVEELEQRHIASIRTTCKHDEMQSVLSRLLPEVFEHAASSGAKMTGPPLVVYHTWGDDTDVEAAVPVAAPIEPQGRVKAATLPAGDAAIAWHLGPYERLGDTHERVQAYLAEHHLEMRASPWEEYWTDPGMEPDPAKWRTKVVYPVQPASGD